MNAIGYAISMIHQKIPTEILRISLLSNMNHMSNIPVSIDSRLKDLVIVKRVMKDIDIIGGTHITVPLMGLEQERLPDNAIVVRIPKSLTQGRSILTVHSVSFGASATAGLTSNPLAYGGDVGNAQAQMLQGISSIPYVSDAHVTLLAENVVMIQNVNTMTGWLYLRCEVENDSNLNNIKRRSFLAFGELCTLAAKSYIYTTCVIPMDIGYIEGGATMGKIQEMIDSYADSEDEYMEYLKTKWAKVSKLNDAETIEQIVRMSSGGLY